MNFNYLSSFLDKKLYPSPSSVGYFFSFFMFFLVSVSFGNVFSQKIELKGDQISLVQYLSQIEKQTGYTFIFDPKIVESSPKISLNISNIVLEEALSQILKNIPITYQIVEKTIVLSQKNVLKPEFFSISGKVLDETGQPLVGVTIKVKNNTQGTLTDQNGIFKLEVPKNSVLQFSFIGYITQEIKIEGNTKINITLNPNISKIKDLVVIGYGTSTKRDITGSISSLKSEDFNQGVLTTPAELLQGKIAGLNITKSGDPNQAPAVILRGPSTIRTLNGGVTEPFYVIDGVPGASVDLLSSDDIESIDVLKDASSTAIYGTRAANGVIIITTKKAKPGQNRLAYSAYGAVENVSNRIDVLSGQQLRDYLAQNGVKALNMPIDDDGSNTNWQKLIERTGYSINQNLSFGATTNQNTSYGASVNYLKNNGILNRTSLERTIFRGYLNQKFFKDHLKLGLTITNSVTNRNDIVQQYVLPGMLFYLPTVSPFNPDGTFKENFSRTGSGPYNPLSLLKNNSVQTNDNRTLVNGLLQVDLLKGLTYTFSGSIQKDQNNLSSYFNSASALALNFNGQAHRTAYQTKNLVIESFFSYDKTWSQHTLKLLGGYSFQQDRTNDGFGVTTQNFLNDNLGANNLFLSNPSQLSQVTFDNNPISTLRLISYYGRIQYQFADRYLLQASLRNDGSSAFGINNRFGYFPAISGGWRIINEGFMKKGTFFNDLKLRVGYGVSGNSQGFDAYSALLVYGTVPGGSSKIISNGNVTNAVGPVRNNNPDLKWESTSTINLGVDFSILKNLLSGSVDYYVKKTQDLIDDALPVSSTQYQYPLYIANVGKLTNSGIEVVLNVDYKNPDFRWRSSINLSHNKNIIDNLSTSQFSIPYIQTAQLGGKGQSGDYSQIVQPGYALGTFYLWHYVGKDANGVSTFQKADGTITNQQPLTTDQRIGGSAQPKLIYGWSNSFNYKNFDFNFLLRGVYGNKILNGTLAALNNPADSKLQNIPRFTLGESFKDNVAYLVSDRFLENGTYFRLDNASLGYSIKSTSSAFKIIRFYVSGNNLFVITNYRGIDPEINIGGLTPGIDNNNYYPKTRTYSFGINASF